MTVNVIEMKELEEMQIQLMKVLLEEANKITIDFNNKTTLSDIFRELDNNIEVFNLDANK